MEETEAGQQGNLRGPLKAALNKIVELDQLVKGFELKPSRAELKGISREMANSRAKMQSLA